VGSDSCYLYVIGSDSCYLCVIGSDLGLFVCYYVHVMFIIFLSFLWFDSGECKKGWKLGFVKKSCSCQSLPLTHEQCFK